MGRIAVSENPFELSEAKGFEHSGPLIGFLQEHYPDGFVGHGHVCLYNLNRLDVKDYDMVVGADDSVVIVILPAFAAAAFAFAGAYAAAVASAANAVVGVAVSMALNYAINAFFGPEGSKPTSPNSTVAATGGGLPVSSPTYSLNVPNNSARLGQPIPVAYGRNPIVPDIASRPYSVYIDNDQYVNVLYCLGQGVFDIHAYYVANTDVSDLAAGVANVTPMTPTNHQNSFGVIQSATGIYENMYTSPEVSDQEFLAGISAEGITGQRYSAVLWYGTWGTYTGRYFRLNVPAATIASVYQNQPVWVVLSNSTNSANDGVYQLGWMANSAESQENGYYAMIGSAGDYYAPWPGGDGNATIVFSLVDPEELNPEVPPGPPTGPFSATTPGVKTKALFYDYVLPQGAYDIDLETGRIKQIAVRLLWTATPIDDNGNVIGAALEREVYEIFSTTTAQRRTTSQTVPEGRYRVTAQRITPKSGQTSAQSTVYWVGLRAVLGNTLGKPVYGGTTIIAARFKATEGLSSDAISRFSVDCTRLNPIAGYHGTRNPAYACLDIITNPTYGGGRPDAEVDWTTFIYYKNRWTEKTFDAVYDTPTNLWEAMGMSLQMVHAAPTMSGSVISLVVDEDHPVAEFYLTPDNIISLTLSFIFPDGNNVDGVEGEYRDPEDSAQLYAVYPSDSVNPESVSLFGCRVYSKALAYVTQRWKQLSLRRLLLQVSVELEGEVLRVGAPVSITHPKLGPDAVLCVLQSVVPSDAAHSTLELHRYEPEVYS